MHHFSVCDHSDSDSNGSDVEDAIMAQLYFRDIQAKKSGMLSAIKTL